VLTLTDVELGEGLIKRDLIPFLTTAQALEELDLMRHTDISNDTAQLFVEAIRTNQQIETIELASYIKQSIRTEMHNICHRNRERKGKEFNIW
jgi:hypothetical protein